MGSPHTTNARGAESNLLTVKDPGASGSISVGERVTSYVGMVTAAAEARTLKDPSHAGQTLTLCLRTDGGDATVTADSQVNQAGNTIMTFADAGDVLYLVGVKEGTSLEWRIIGNDGISLS